MVNSAAQTVFSGCLYDGQTPYAHAVQVHISIGSIRVTSTRFGSEHSYDICGVSVSAPLRAAPCLIRLPHGQTIEIQQSARLVEHLESCGVVPPWWARILASSPAMAFALLFLIWACVFGYSAVLPAISDSIVFQLPRNAEDALGAEVLATLDRRHLLPSQLAQDRQSQLRTRFQALVNADGPHDPVEIVFRRARVGEGINAFAVPGNQIVVLDGLVEFAGDDETLGVLAHELGHVRRKHILRKSFQAAGVIAAAAVVWGDYSGVASVSASWLAVMHYSRINELEADEFAVHQLTRAGMAPDGLAKFLRRLQRLQGANTARSDVLSSHPDLVDRVSRIENLISR